MTAADVHHGETSEAVRLAPTPLAPRASRRLVRNACAQGPSTVEFVDDAALVMSELVTLSIRHARVKNGHQ